MVRNRILYKTKERHKRTIRDVIKGLSRRVKVYLQPLKSECPNCFYDKFTNRSTGKCKWTAVEALQKQTEWETSTCYASTIRYRYFLKGRCPVCKGQGYIETQRTTWINCLVTWNPREPFGNEMTYTPAGSEGSNIVRLKTDPKNYDTFKNADRVIVDGVECRVSRPPVTRGLGTQAVLVITVFKTKKPKNDSNEIIKDYN